VPTFAQLAIRYHRVHVTIEDQIAVTHVDQVFYNPNDWQVEGTYMFPIPADAAVSGFTLWVDGEPVEGKVLEADEARRTYEEIVSSLRDPALLEYAGRGAVQARIFPIPPGGERRVELEYEQALPAENGLVRYTYPLNTEKFSTMPLEDVSISVEISSSSAPIRAIYSPSHSIGVVRDGDQRASVGYEDSDVLPSADFALYYSLGSDQAFHLMSFRDPGDSVDSDGFFLLLLAPRPDATQTRVAKDVILVLDRSGSMEGEKFQQARQALKYILEHLNPEDRFNVIAFSTGNDAYAADLRPQSEASQASAWVDRLSPVGNTDINRALLEAAAIAESGRPTYLIFLTDGLPTEGVVDSQQILDNLNREAGDNLRLFSFGVGYDVDTFLLDSLSQEHHGTSSYVVPGERLDEALSAFYTRISSPVMTGLELDFADVNVYDLYPDPLPDLFAGSQIVLVGRYRQPGSATVTLTGSVGAEKQTYRFPEQVFDAESSTQNSTAALPRLWATRKIGYLLNQVRLNGPDAETIDQIVRLSIRYGIVTPYTSYLVTEPMPLGMEGQSRIVEETVTQMQAMPTAAVSGQEAVEKAADLGAMAGAEVPAPSSEAEADIIRQVGARSYVLSDGVWIDTAFDPQTTETIKVPFLSQAYFELLKARPELSAGFALGPRVIAFAQGSAYEVVGEGETVSPIDIPAVAAPTASGPSEQPEDLTPTPAPPTATPAASNGSSGCLGSLLPLGLAAAAWVVLRRR
jgi:Ca-activated chloride channel family protein